MIDYTQALAFIRGHAPYEFKSLEVSLSEALGRVVSRDYHSDQYLPPYANSGVDGFAVRSQETQTASPASPIQLPILGTIVAGDVPPPANSDFGVWEIMTGAPFPDGFDAAVKIEEVEVNRDPKDGSKPFIQLAQPVEKGDFYRDAGEDFSPGTLVIRKGQRVTPEFILALSSLGISRVEVYKKPKVIVISTGKEIASVDSKNTIDVNIRPGQIRNSTVPFLMAALSQLGVEGSFIESNSDDASQFRDVVQKALSQNPEILITTGGVSMGQHDFVPGSLKELGAEILFHKMAIRPGKPNLFAKFKNGTVVFGLPGNPVSTVVGLRFLVEPYLRSGMNMPIEVPMKAKLKNPVRKPEGLRCFYKAYLEIGQDSSQVSVLEGQASFLVRPLLKANVWAVFPEVGSQFDSESWVDIYPISSSHSWNQNDDERNQKIVMRGCC
jgi:molybdopterin molybdotransferase